MESSKGFFRGSLRLSTGVFRRMPLPWTRYRLSCSIIFQISGISCMQISHSLLYISYFEYYHYIKYFISHVYLSNVIYTISYIYIYTPFIMVSTHIWEICRILFHSMRPWRDSVWPTAGSRSSDYLMEGHNKCGWFMYRFFLPKMQPFFQVLGIIILIISIY